MKNIHLFKQLLSVAIMMCISSGLSAQVTIGSCKEPAVYSLLELDASSAKGGLRLPQLSGAEITAFKALVTTLDDRAKGLMFYNVDNGCVEVWDGTEWICLKNGGGGEGGGFTQTQIETMIANYVASNVDNDYINSVINQINGDNVNLGNLLNRLIALENGNFAVKCQECAECDNCAGCVESCEDAPNTKAIEVFIQQYINQIFQGLQCVECAEGCGEGSNPPCAAGCVASCQEGNQYDEGTLRKIIEQIISQYYVDVELGGQEVQSNISEIFQRLLKMERFYLDTDALTGVGIGSGDGEQKTTLAEILRRLEALEKLSKMGDSRMYSCRNEVVGGKTYDFSKQKISVVRNGSAYVFKSEGDFANAASMSFTVYPTVYYLLRATGGTYGNTDNTAAGVCEILSWYEGARTVGQGWLVEPSGSGTSLTYTSIPIFFDNTGIYFTAPGGTVGSKVPQSIQFSQTLLINRPCGQGEVPCFDFCVCKTGDCNTLANQYCKP